jgi:hypothetical protein
MGNRHEPVGMCPGQDGECLPVTVLGLLDEVAIQSIVLPGAHRGRLPTLLSRGGPRAFNLQIRMVLRRSGRRVFAGARHRRPAGDRVDNVGYERRGYFVAGDLGPAGPGGHARQERLGAPDPRGPGAHPADPANRDRPVPGPRLPLRDGARVAGLDSAVPAGAEPGACPAAAGAVEGAPVRWKRPDHKRSPAACPPRCPHRGRDCRQPRPRS